jgi:23S rRNA pseudouridine1911/1915/1917 synthase
MPKVKFESIIISESEYWIILNKPSGMITESNPYETALQDHLLDYLKKTKKSPFLGVVHRLDKVTSGLIIFAKKKSSLKVLNEMIAKRQIKKRYQAIVENKPESDSAILNNFIEKDLREKKAIVHSKKIKTSKEAKLKYSIHKKTPFGYLLNIDLFTGRFHQIRAQLAHINSPIIGDSKYGGKKHKAISSDKILLHAFQLSFPQNTIDLPRKIQIDIKLPND